MKKVHMSMLSKSISAQRSSKSAPPQKLKSSVTVSTIRDYKVWVKWMQFTQSFFKKAHKTSLKMAIFRICNPKLLESDDQHPKDWTSYHTPDSCMTSFIYGLTGAMLHQVSFQSSRAFQVSKFVLLHGCRNRVTWSTLEYTVDTSL